MMTLLCAVVSSAWGETQSVTISPSQALNNGGVSPITVTCAKGDGTSNPAISSGQLRLYQAASGKTTGNTISFSSAKTITSIVFTFANNMTADNGVFSEGTYDSATSTWTGSTNSVTLTVIGNSSSKRIYITNMVVYYDDGGVITVAAPTFSPSPGTYTEAQTVSISAEDGATIYYTTDESTPSSSNGTEYSSAINISETTTIKAIAVKDGVSSDVASATYTIVAPYVVEDGIFNFVEYGYGMTQDNSGYNDNPTILEAGNITINLSGGSNSRYYNNSGSLELRVYKACTMKISAPEGKVITKVEFETGTPLSRILYDGEPLATALPEGTVPTNGAWEGCMNEVTFTFSNTVNISKITVTYGNAPIIALDPNTPNPITIPYTGTVSSEDNRVYIIDRGVADIGIQFYDADQTTPLQSAPSWFVSEIDTHSNVLYSIGENTGEERTVYFKVWGAETPNATENDRIYTDLVTITQEAAPITIAEARAQEVGDVVFTKGVVTSISGTNNKTVYIQDATAAICVYGSISTDLTIGDEITVSGTLKNYNGLLEITSPTCNVVSNDNEVEPTLMTISEINASTNQGWLVKIENATVSTIIGKDVTISQGENSIVVRFNDTADITFAVNDIINLTGNIGCYNITQIANPTNVEIQEGDKYYVAGTWTSWATNMIEMTKNSEGKYILTGQQLAAEVEFKIVKVAGESSTWYGGQADGDQYWLTADNHTDIQLVNGANFYMPIAGTWTFTVDPNNGSPKLTVEGSWPEPDYFLVGTFNNWTTSDDYKLTKDETTGKYTISAAIAQGETFKIIDSDGIWYGAVSNGDFYVEANFVGTELSLASPGNNYYMNLSNTANWSIVFDPANMQLVLSNYVLPDPNASYVYQKVTKTEDLTSGKYLIVYEDASVAFDGSLTTLDAGNNTQDVVITVFDKIYMKDAIYFNIDPTAGTIQSASGKYIGVSSNSNGLKTSDDPEAYTNSFAIDEDGNAVISAVFNGSTMTLLFNKSTGDGNFRFRYYKAINNTNVPIQLYKQVVEEPYTVTIQSQATDGTDYYATMADIGAGYFEVPEGVEVKTVNVINGKLNYPTTFTKGDVITGQGAYLVVASAAESYTFPTVLEGTTTLPDNDLKSSGKGNLSATAMAAANDGNFKFYKLSLRNGKIGFYWGAADGAAFEYTKKQQAYLVVAQPETGNSELASAYFFDGDATGIYSVNAEIEDTEAEGVYSLSGVRMDGKALPKGVYIVNGKKKVIK